MASDLQIKRLSAPEVRMIIRSGRFDELVGVTEEEAIEFKAEVYPLNTDAQKQELAKDISGMANARGGLIVLGVKTTKRPDVRSDIVTEIRPFSQALLNADQFSQIVKDWIYPRIEVSPEWIPSADDPSKGVIVVEVPSAAQEARPYLVKRYVNDEGKADVNVFGYYVRRQENVEATTFQEVHSWIRRGIDQSFLSDRLSEIERTIQRLAEPVAAGKESKMVNDRITHMQTQFKRERDEAIQAVGFETAPSLVLAAYPTATVEMHGLFARSESDLIDRLHDSPKLRGHGWDLGMDEPFESIHGRLRRQLKRKTKLLQISRDGIVIFLERGGRSFLSRSASMSSDSALIVHPFVLAHVVLVFVMYCKEIFSFARPVPNEITCILQLRNMTNGGKPAMLQPNHGRLNTWPEEWTYKRMEGDSQSFEDTFQLEQPAGRITYELVRRVFEAFGFDADQVPYTRMENGAKVIDTQSLFGGGVSTTA